jgi:hypothetical protein
MMYAVIRAGGEALHFIAELNPYNLQTLRDYARGIARDRGPAELRISFDATDEIALRQLGERWLPRLAASGVSLFLEPLNGTAAAARPPSAEPYLLQAG